MVRIGVFGFVRGPLYSLRLDEVDQTQAILFADCLVPGASVYLKIETIRAAPEGSPLKNQRAYVARRREAIRSTLYKVVAVDAEMVSLVRDLA